MFVKIPPMHASLHMPVRFRLADAIAVAETNQSELARRSGVSIVTINAIANNRTTQVQLKTLDRLSKELGCNPGDLIERVPDAPPREQRKRHGSGEKARKHQRAPRTG